MNLRFNDDELSDVSVAAMLAGLTPSSYAARMAVAVARNEVTPIPTDYREQLGELVQARVALNRIGSNLNQMARTLNAGGDVTETSSCKLSCSE